MKVEHPRTAATPAIDTEPTPSRPAGKKTGTSADSVALSGTVGLAQAATRAVEAALAPRADAIARGRAVMAAGDDALNLEQLADRLIDHLTYRNDDDAS
jgi:hypothetical protein